MQRIKLLVIGVGPTGLGAALRRIERGESSVLILEAGAEPGGLASSVRDPQGFTWDLGSHLQFSHYEKFDAVLDAAMADSDWYHHDRSTWIRLGEESIPYPFQHNLHRLPPMMRWECVQGLLNATAVGDQPGETDFRTWIGRTFGAGIAAHFLCPYNSKIWAWPLEDMSHRRVGERVALARSGNRDEGHLSAAGQFCGDPMPAFGIHEPEEPELSGKPFRSGSLRTCFVFGHA